ncbi:MAG TPA: hypothetical protein VKH64_07395 [Candidatus Binatia bacterium]|nr:hypothetical protein [Candidatus Binatia bacterium]
MSLNKKTNMLYAAAAFAAVLALQAAPVAAQSQWSPADENPKATVVPDNYCNIKIPAPNNDKPSGNDEDQMTQQWDDWVDYSGPCDQADEAHAVQSMREETSPDD